MLRDEGQYEPNMSQPLSRKEKATRKAVALSYSRDTGKLALD